MSKYTMYNIDNNITIIHNTPDTTTCDLNMRGNVYYIIQFKVNNSQQATVNRLKSFLKI